MVDVELHEEDKEERNQRGTKEKFVAFGKISRRFCLNY